MILFAILIAITAIGLFCWLLFTLATFALPLFAGIAAGTWAYHTGSGWIGAILIGLIGAALTLGLGRFLLIVVRPIWARLLIALIFVAPAAIAGYHATHGIVKHAMPSESWQIAFSIIGALAVGITTFLRVAGMAAPLATQSEQCRHHRGHADCGWKSDSHDAASARIDSAVVGVTTFGIDDRGDAAGTGRAGVGSAKGLPTKNDGNRSSL
eukprot:gene19091-19449_t